jgi:hypothetical protein
MLVNCVAYQDGRKLADIDRHAIHDYVKRPNCFVWVALRDPSESDLDEMKVEFDLHELAVEDAHHGHQRPKIMVRCRCASTPMGAYTRAATTPPAHYRANLASEPLKGLPQLRRRSLTLSL